MHSTSFSLWLSGGPPGAHPNTRPLCPRALTQLFRSRISRRLLWPTLSNWDKSKWIRYLTCANGMFVHKGLWAALCLEWTGKNKVCELNWVLWETHKGSWTFGTCWSLWYGGGCWDGPTPPIPPTCPPQPKMKRRWQTYFKVIKWLNLTLQASGPETSTHTLESPAWLIRPPTWLGPAPKVWLSSLGWGWRIWISNRFPGDASASRLGSTL